MPLEEAAWLAVERSAAPGAFEGRVRGAVLLASSAAAFGSVSVFAGVDFPFEPRTAAAGDPLPGAEADGLRLAGEGRRAVGAEAGGFEGPRRGAGFGSAFPAARSGRARSRADDLAAARVVAEGFAAGASAVPAGGLALVDAVVAVADL